MTVFVWVLVVVNEVIMYFHLIRTNDSSAGVVSRWRLIRSFIVTVHNINRHTTPAGDFHIRNLDIDTSMNTDSPLIGRLLAKARPEKTKAGNPNVVVDLSVCMTYDL